MNRNIYTQIVLPILTEVAKCLGLTIGSITLFLPNAGCSGKFDQHCAEQDTL